MYGTPLPVDEISARMPTRSEAELLVIPAATAVAEHTGTGFDTAGRPGSHACRGIYLDFCRRALASRQLRGMRRRLIMVITRMTEW
jgi:hypothetical protein